MTYSALRKRAKTGDIFAVRGTGLVSWLIRAATGESYSHVALLVWIHTGLYVFEFVEGVGYQSMPASEWLRRRQGQQLCYGVGPKILATYSERIREAAIKYRHSSVMSRMYGYLSLLKVWAGQILGRNIHVHQKVCSTFVQECWAAGTFHMGPTADPGDIASACSEIHVVYTEGETP